MSDVMSEELENALLKRNLDIVRRILEGGGEDSSVGAMKSNCWSRRLTTPMHP
jgi:hypothetical protein